MFAGEPGRQLFHHAANVVVVGAGQLVQIGRQRRFDQLALAGGIHVQPVLSVHVGSNLLLEILAQIAQKPVAAAAAISGQIVA